MENQRAAVRKIFWKSHIDTDKQIYQRKQKETDLIVKAYAYLPFYLLLDNITVYLLALLNVMGLTVFFYMKRHTKNRHKP